MAKIKTTSKIKKTQAENFFWIDINNPGKEELDFIRQTFEFHPLDIEDIKQKTQRSKIDKYTKYIFLALLFPVYNTTTQEIEYSEVDIFLGNDFLVTIHKSDMPLFEKLIGLCQVDQNSKEKILGNNPAKLMYEILDRLYTYCFPMLDHISTDLEEMEKRIFGNNEKEMVENILSVRRNITNYRKMMQPHRKVLQKLMKGNQKSDLFYINNGYEVYIDNLVDHAKEIWEALDAFKESVEALHETNEAIFSHKLNKTMKTLTAVSVILLPLNIIIALWGMNLDVPFTNNEFGFWIIVIITVILGALFALYLRFIKWL